jgi:hypothetical protein
LWTEPDPRREAPDNVEEDLRGLLENSFRGCFETSAKTGEGVERVLDKAALALAGEAIFEFLPMETRMHIAFF